MHKTVILNSVVLNGGDAAILEAVLQSVEVAFPNDPSPLVFDRDSQVSEKYYSNIKFSKPGFEICRSSLPGRLGQVVTTLSAILLLFEAYIWRFLGKKVGRATSDRHAYLGAMANAERAVSTGGTMFVERYSIFPKFVEIKIAEIFHLDIYLFTQSFETINRFHNKLMMRSILRSARVIMMRGEESRLAISNLGLFDEKAHVLADAVFRFFKPVAQSTKNGTICISVRPWNIKSSPNAQGRYRQEIAKLCVGIVEKLDKDVMFVSTCQGIPEYNVHDDSEASIIHALLPSEIASRVIVNRDFHRHSELMQIFSSADAVIATRLHACILALCAGSIVLPIAYERKTHEVFSRVAPDMLVFDYDGFSAAEMLETLALVLVDPDARRITLKRTLALEAESAKLADTYLQAPAYP